MGTDIYKGQRLALTLGVALILAACSGGGGDEGGDEEPSVDQLLEEQGILSGDQPDQQQANQQQQPMMPVEEDDDPPAPRSTPSPTPTPKPAPADTTAPSITGLADDATPTSSKSWSPGCSESNCEMRYLVDGSATGTPSGAWEVLDNITVSNPQGTVYLHIQVRDAAGNASAVSHYSAVIDSVAPDAIANWVLSSPATSPSNDTTIEIDFDAIAEDQELTLYGNADCSNELESYSLSAGADTISHDATSEGTFNFSVITSDALGNASGCQDSGLSIEIDTSISEITGVAVTSPGVLGNDPTPTITVSGVDDGDVVRVYTSSSCFVSDQVGFETASGSSAVITTSALASDGAVEFYARSFDQAGNISDCSTMHADYTLDRDEPSAPTGVSRTSPVGATGTDDTPTFEVSGVTIGDTLMIFDGASCDTLLGTVTVNANPMSLDTDALSTEGQITVYAATEDGAGNRSDCSTANATYNYDVFSPTLSNVHIESGGGTATAGVGSVAVLTFDASEPLSSTTVTIIGQAAAVTNPSGNSYRATYTLQATDSSGLITFSIDYEDSAARSGTTVTAVTDGSSLLFDNSDYAPVPDVSNQVENEGNTFNYDVNDASAGGDDLDENGDPVTYTCYYDTNPNGTVAKTNLCTELTGFNLTPSTGVISWLLGYFTSSTYEISMVGTDGSMVGEGIFTLTVNNVNRPPNLQNVDDQNLSLGETFAFNMNDTTGNDTDIDGNTIIYSCHYDTDVDGTVGTANLCRDLDGLDFNDTTGSFSWTVEPTTPGTFEMQITGDDQTGGAEGPDTDTELFVAEVTIDISRLPQIAMVGTATASNVASLADDNLVTLNGSPINGSPTDTIYQAGDVFTITSTNEGDLLECSGGCFAITPIDGTAAWATESYAGTILSTYMGRYVEAKIMVAAFDQAATNIEIWQDGVKHDEGPVPANSVEEFIVTHNVGSLWILSDAPIAAYVSTKDTGDATYERDGRIITAPGKENLAFVSGGGGTPSGVSTTVDGTVVNAYRNDGTSFENQALDISGIVDVTSSSSQNSADSAIAIYSTNPTVTTQHADGDGTNASPSLPKSMLSTNFVAPVDGDYASFASFEEGDLIILDSVTGAVTNRFDLTRDGSAHAQAPWAYSYNIASIPAGTRFVCTTPCLGIYEPVSSDDETLMTGTNFDFSLTSSDMSSGADIPAAFVGSRTSECSGNNDFPELVYANQPWGTTHLAVIVENTTDTNYVHLNLVDIDPSNNGILSTTASGGVVTFASGTAGLNGYGTSGWSGPCDDSAQNTYTFAIFALSQAIGAQVDNTSISSFASTYENIILDQANFTVTYGTD